jgi:predicted DNA-binding transcriptional regulator YafY
MLGHQVARQWRILRTIESRRHGATVAELAAQEDCHTRTIWRDLAAIQEAGFPFYSEKGGQKSRWRFVEGYTFHLPVPFTVTAWKSKVSGLKSEFAGSRC